MEFQDRISAYPNRYLLTAADGSSSYVVLERADEPITVGTPLNAETMNQMASKEELDALRAEISALKGVDLWVESDGQSYGENRVRSDVDVMDFDYFLVYGHDREPPHVMHVTEKNRESRTVRAQENWWQQDGIYLEFTWEEQGGWYLTHFYEDNGGLVDLPYSAIYGYKYPK